MHFLITGGAGFIGSHLTEKLLAEGHEVTVVDNLSTGNLTNLPNHKKLNLIQKNILLCGIDDFKKPLDGIAHLAANASVEKSWLEPLVNHQNNLSATLKVIELCRSLNIPRLVYASSAAVYGDQSKLPISEDMANQPLSPYGLQKLCSEQYAHLFSKNSNFTFIGLRLFNVFGTRQLPDSGYSGVISIFVNAMKQNLPIKIYGDGLQSRDFVYVEDVANVFFLALTTNNISFHSKIYNVGTGQSTSLLQLVTILKTCFPYYNIPIQFMSTREGDITHSQADISKVCSEFNFKPKWNIQLGLQKLTAQLN